MKPLDDNPLFPLRVAMWGPSGSGKTQLVNTLMQSIFKFNQADLHMIYEKAPDEFVKQLVPNLDPDQTVWMIGRQRKPALAYDRAKEKSLRISTHNHTLLIYDPTGGKALSYSNYSNSPYADAHLVILVLDPTLHEDATVSKQHGVALFPVSTGPLQSENEIDLSEFVRQSAFFRDNPAESVKMFVQNTSFPEVQKGITRERYFNEVKKLFRSINRQKQRIVVCITKRDLLPLNEYHLSPLNLLQKYFGEELKNLLLLPLTQTPVFVVSTDWHRSDTGYDSKDTLDSQFPKELRNILLMLLQVRERRRIRSDGGFFAPLFRGENLRKYIPYIQDEHS